MPVRIIRSVIGQVDDRSQLLDAGNQNVLPRKTDWPPALRCSPGSSAKLSINLGKVSAILSSCCIESLIR